MSAYRESTRLISETCPTVDSIFDEAVGKIKNITSEFRETLVRVIEENMELGEQIEDMERIIKDLEDELSCWKSNCECS